MMDRVSVAERLAQARLAAGFKSPREAAQRYGWNENTYKSRENGLRGVSVDDAKKYSKAFNVSHFWLLTGELIELDRATISVVGRVLNDNIVNDDYEEKGSLFIKYVQCLIPMPARCVGFFVVDMAMYPRYDGGDIIIVSIDDVDLEVEVENIEAVISYSVSGYNKLVKRIFPGNEQDRYDLESHNWPTIRNFHIGRAQAVIGVVRAHQQKGVETVRDDARLGNLARKISENLDGHRVGTNRID